MTKKERKIGRRRRKVTIRKLTSRRISDPAIELNISTGYQGVKKVKELAEIEKVTINQKVLKKLRLKGGSSDHW